MRFFINWLVAMAFVLGFFAAVYGLAQVGKWLDSTYGHGTAGVAAIYLLMCVIGTIWAYAHTYIKPKD